MRGYLGNRRFDPSRSAYAPFDRSWIKQQAFQRLKRQASSQPNQQRNQRNQRFHRN